MGCRYGLRRVSAPKVDMPMFRQIYRRRPFNNGSSSYFASKVPRFAHHMLTTGDGVRCLPHPMYGGHIAIPDALVIVCYGRSASVRRCCVGMEVHSEAPCLIRLPIARQSERGKLVQPKDLRRPCSNRKTFLLFKRSEMVGGDRSCSTRCMNTIDVYVDYIVS